jgi:gluconate 2-dehydrogenase gamma chain
MVRSVSRREMLKQAAAVGALTAAPHYSLAQAGGSAPYVNLTAAAARTLEAIVARLIPSDDNGPGAAEAGAARYIDGALGNALAGSREIYAAGLAAVEAYAQSAAGQSFAQLAPARQDALLRDVEQNLATGFAAGSAAFFNLVLGHTLEGTFSDPRYGGNQDFVGWDLIGYPGIRLAVGPEQQRMGVLPVPVRVSIDDLSMFDAGETPPGEAR